MDTGKQVIPFEGMFKMGYYIALFGTAFLLLWIGAFKFTQAEAAAIEPLVKHHPLFQGMYKVLELQTVSNIVGIVEILVALLLLLSIRFHFLIRYAGLGLIAIFFVTLTFLFSTPGMWRIRDNFIVTDFFILKDIGYLGFGMMLLGISQHKKTIS
uniref:YkgB family protein n=2 Tax=unclassified Prevotella TaxID=2638335 RepID=A0AB33JN43_9BACT